MDMRRRGVYPTAKQKKKLIELMVKHPELVSFKLTQGFNHKECQQLWQSVANQCNAIPGARKTWRQWRKTWQDIRSKARIRQQQCGDIPPSKTMLTTAEQEVLGLKNVSSTTNPQDSLEFVPLDEQLQLENIEDSFGNELESTASLSGSESTPEEKVFTSLHRVQKSKSRKKKHSEHSDKCIFNCDLLAVQEQKKFQIKEDYYNFKKDYLKQKLLLMKEQTEALKGIAKELAK